MKQLMIIKSNQTALKTAMADIVSNEGSIGFFKFDNSAITGLISEDFYIAHGRPNGQHPMVIPEVDFNSMSVTKSTPQAASTFNVVFALPQNTNGEVEVDEDFTIMLVKQGVVPHQRNTWSFTYRNKYADPAAATAAFVNEFNKKFQMMSFPFIASNSDNDIDNSDNDTDNSDNNTDITITCSNVGEQWTIKFADMLFDLNTNGNATITNGYPAMLDKAYVQNLASECAAGKGFTDTYRNGDTTIPGYPETVEDTTYNLYTLRFQVGRKAAKTRDEKVWQVVHIAVPTNNSDMNSALATLFGIS